MNLHNRCQTELSKGLTSRRSSLQFPLRFGNLLPQLPYTETNHIGIRVLTLSRFIYLVNTSEVVRDVLSKFVSAPVIFKRLTKFTVDEFYELCHHLSHVLHLKARSTGDLSSGAGCQNYIRKQRILNTLVYLEHVNTVLNETFQ